jgi:F0F1-type ATP synthase delta subunit
MSKERILAKRYTKALFGLARDSNLEDRVGSDITRIVSANELCRIC